MSEINDSKILTVNKKKFIICTDCSNIFMKIGETSGIIKKMGIPD